MKTDELARTVKSEYLTLKRKKKINWKKELTKFYISVSHEEKINEIDSILSNWAG
jgi:hypothetical protein